MKSQKMFDFWIILAFCFLFSNTVHAIWPQPSSITTGNYFLRLSSDFTIQTSKLTSLYQYPDLKQATIESLHRIQNDNLQVLNVDRGASYSKAVNKAHTLSSLILLPAINCQTGFSDISGQITLPLDQRDESYNLAITKKGVATLSACNALGLFRGLATFEQLVYVLPQSTTKYIGNVPISIQDKPAYPYRGFMLDTSRNFYPPKVIQKIFQAMAFSKLSIFHWHVTDSQSFPVVLHKYPDIAAKGAYNPEAVYTAAEVTRLVKYANSHGIDVILEFDNPAHTGSLQPAYPDLIDCWKYDWQTYAQEPPAGQLDITSQKAINLVRGIYADLVHRSPSRYFHAGGDELNAACFAKDHPNANFESSLDNFVARTQSVIIAAKKQRIVWEDLALSHPTIGLSKTDTILMVWSNPDNIMKAIEKGYRVIHALYTNFYLDCGQGAWVSNSPSGSSWCDFVSWQRMWLFDPLAGMNAQQAKLVQGGQSLLWSEQSSPQNVEPQIWPRAAVAAEVFWTPKGGRGSIQDANTRLNDFRYRLVQRDIDAIAIQPEWCALRPGQCSL